MDKKISELDQALQINNDAVFPMSQNNSGTDTTYKASITQLSTEIGEGQTFSNLQTTDKTLVGAINEVAQGGGGGGSSNANLAPDYDATSTYAVGDWCIYNGTLYQCNTAIPTAEAFDPTHWTAKKVVDAFADIEDELDDKVDQADFTADLLPIQSGSSTNTKDYIDSKVGEKVGAWTYNGQYTINGVTGSVNWNLIDTLPNNTKELLFAICIGGNHRVMRWSLTIPFDVFGDYGCFPDFSLGTDRLYCTLSKNSNSQIGISGVNIGTLTSDITLNCYYR